MLKRNAHRVVAGLNHIIFQTIITISLCSSDLVWFGLFRQPDAALV